MYFSAIKTPPAGDRVRPGFWARRYAIAALCTVFASTAVVGAEDIELPMTADGEPTGVFEADVGETFEMPLEDAVVQALRHNVSLVVQRYARSRSLLGVQEAVGIYDFEFAATVLANSGSRPPQSLLEDADVLTTDSEAWNFSLSRLTPWGGTAEVSWNNSLSESNNAFVVINPQYRVDLNLGFVQPLMRNFGREVTERDIVVARNNTEINRETFRLQVETVVQQVSNVYWDLVGAKEQLEVAEKSLDLAKELHEMNRIQVDVGTKAPLEMVQSEAGVARREEDIIRRQQAVADAEDNLRQLVNFASGELWDVPIIPVTAPELAHEPIDVKEAVEDAFKMRADVIQQRLRNRTAKLDANVAKNNMRPRLDLTAGYVLDSLAGDDTMPMPDDDGNLVDNSTNYGDALDSIISADFDGWQVRLDFSMPLENRAARSRAAQADLLVQQGDWELRDLEGNVRLDVRRTARAVETANKAIESAKVSSRLAEKNLEAERKR
ncbi:MAG: TolC family protein, partial [Acidobacteriota bacterium]